MKQSTPTIGILGAGAVGSYLVMGLSEKYKKNLWIIADGERKNVWKKTDSTSMTNTIFSM